MKYYVYAGYYENIISGHKLRDPYVLRDVFKTFEDAQIYLEDEFEDDGILYTKDVEDDAYSYYGYLEDGDLDDHIINESTKSSKKSLREKAHFMFDVDLVFDILTSVVDYEDWGYEYSEPYVQLKESSPDYEEYILGGCKNLTSYIKDLEKAFNKIWNKGIFTIKPYGYKDEKLILTIDYNI